MRFRATAAALLLTAAAAAPAAAQFSEERARSFMEDCDDGRGRMERHCEIRDTTMAVSGGRVLIDGRDNGGITVRGWDQSRVQVRAFVQAWAYSESEAADIARDIRVATDGGRIRAEGPSQRGRPGWSVSYEVLVPRRVNLEAEAHNGGISLDGVEGQLRLYTVNGGLRLSNVAGDVRGETTNGGVRVTLAGSGWTGTGLDLETTNGGVTLDLPAGYNAQLETGTVNGGMNIDFPITVQGLIGRRIRTTLGRGGAPIRVTTTNGGVRIRELR